MDPKFVYAGNPLVHLVNRLDGVTSAVSAYGPWFCEHDNHDKMVRQWAQYCRGFAKMIDEFVVAHVRNQWMQNESPFECGGDRMPWALIGSDHPMIHLVEVTEIDMVPLRFSANGSEPIVPYGNRIDDDGEHAFVSPEWDTAPREACFWAAAKPRPVDLKIDIEYVKSVDNTCVSYADRGQLIARIMFGKEQAPAHWFITERKPVHA